MWFLVALVHRAVQQRAGGMQPVCCMHMPACVRTCTPQEKALLSTHHMRCASSPSDAGPQAAEAGAVECLEGESAEAGRRGSSPLTLERSMMGGRLTDT